MTHPSSFPIHPFCVGTQVVTLRDVIGQNGRTLHPRGSVGVVVRSPRDLEHSYRVRFPDGVEEALKPNELTLLAKHKEGEIGDSDITAGRSNLFERVIYRCVIGARAYGLEDDQSDTDYRGFYLPPADLQWSLFGEGMHIKIPKLSLVVLIGPNHDMKLLRKLRGKNVQITHGLAESLGEIEALPDDLREPFSKSLVDFLDGLVRRHALSIFPAGP